MATLITATVHVHNLNPLSGYATDGISLTALYGLTKAVEFKSGILANAFNYVCHSYTSKLNEHLEQARDQETTDKQVKKKPSQTSERHADAQLTLVFCFENTLSEDEQALFVNTLNSCRVQGGSIMNLLQLQENSFVKVFEIDDIHNEAVVEILQESIGNKIATIPAKTEVTQAAKTFKDFAELLTHSTKYWAIERANKYIEDEKLGERLENPYSKNNYIFVCTGYLTHAKLQNFGSYSELPIVEPAYMVLEAVPLYELNAEVHDVLFTFNSDLNIDNPDVYLIH